jgi:hypothetical protein
MRRAVCRWSTKDYNRLFLQVLSAAKASDPEHAGRAIEDALLDQTADSRRWPTDAEFAESLTQPNIFNLLIRARLKALLVGLDNHLRSDKTEPSPWFLSRDPRLNIEHVMPQSWEKNWPLDAVPSGPDYDEQLARRRDAVNRLGNLTLTTNKMNPSLSNKAWKQKKRELSKHTLVGLTRLSVINAPEVLTMDDETWASVWDEERITLRGRWLAEQALRVWPRPVSSHRSSAL